MVRTVVGGLAALCLLVGVLVFLTPPSYAGSPVTLKSPTISGQTVRLAGRITKPRGRVGLQERTGGAWQTVARKRASPKGRFTFVRTVPSTDTWFRVTWGKRKSVRRLVRGRDRCGVRPQRADGTLWSCTFVDNFGGTAIDRSRWTPLIKPGKGSTLACSLDDERLVSVRDGTLRLTVRPSGDGLACPIESDLQVSAQYAAGSVSSYRHFDQRYGRFEARIRAHPTSHRGLQEAFWLWPAWDIDHVLEVWPAAGEIDISETYSLHPELSIPFLHYNDDDNGGPVPGLNTAWDCRAPRGVFHTYRLDWTANRVTIWVDGRRCLTNTAAAPSYRKRFFVNLTQLIGQAANSYDGRAPLPATMEVDYVKVWR